MAEIDYYKVLQIDHEAEPDIVKAVYWKLSQKYHPDGSKPDPEKMRLINDAHEVIGDPARRKRYDSHRQYGWDPVKESDSTRSPAYWNPPQSAYNPDTRRARRKYRTPAIPAPVGIVGALAIIAFVAITLQSGFGFVQRAASSSARTPTPALVERWFNLTVDELKTVLASEGFEFKSDVLGNTENSSTNDELRMQISLVESGIFVKSVILTISPETEADDPGLRPEQHDLIAALLEHLGATGEASEFIASGVDFWTGYQVDGAVFQSSGVTLELGTDTENHKISIEFSPAP